MTTYVARRVLMLVPLWLGISLIAFVLATLSPGDPARLMLQAEGRPEPSPAEIEAMRQRLGLDEPAPVRYAKWVADAATGDLGTSYRSGQPVLAHLLDRSLVTLRIAVPAMLIALALSLPVGVLAALRRNSLADHASRVVALTADSLPTYWLAYLLIILLSLELGLLPVSGLGTWQHYVLPAVTLGAGTTASMMRLMRSSLLEVLDEDYIRTARAKGLSAFRVIQPHALKNALIPVVTVAGMVLAHFITGTVIVEEVFAWPGVGKFVVDSIFARDYPVVQGFVVLAGTVFLLINLLVDLIYVWLDPRIRLGEGAS